MGSTKRWTSRLKKLFVAAVIAVAGTLLAIEYVIGPAIVRQQLQEDLADPLGCTLRVGWVNFNYLAPIEVWDLELIDEDDHRTMHGDHATIVLENWPGWNPQPSDFTIDRATLTVNLPTGATPTTQPMAGTQATTAPPPTHGTGIVVDRDGPSTIAATASTNGTIALPAVNTTNPTTQTTTAAASGSSSELTVKNVRIGQVIVHVVDASNRAIDYDPVTFRAQRHDRTFDISIERVRSDADHKLKVVGSINADTTAFSGRVQMHHVLSAAQAKFALQQATFNAATSVAGCIDADVIASGQAEPWRLDSCDGTVLAKDVAIDVVSGRMLSDLDATVQFDEKHIDVQRVSAKSCAGTLQGKGSIDFVKGGPATYTGQFRAAKLSLAELTTLTQSSRKVDRGTTTFGYAFSGTGASLEGLKGNGSLLIDNANLWSVPVVMSMFRLSGLGAYDPLSISDVVTDFENSGSRVTVQMCRLGNKVGAIEAEPGGWADLRKQTADVYVVVVPLSAVRTVFLKVPIVRSFVHLRDSLTRLRVVGTWANGEHLDVTKQPLHDLTQGTLGFFKEVGRSGGQLEEKLRSDLTDLFDRKK